MSDRFISAICDRDGVGCDGFEDDRPCGCGCHEEGVVFKANEDVKEWHRVEPEEPVSDDDGGQADAAERMFLDGEGTLSGDRFVRDDRDE